MEQSRRQFFKCIGLSSAAAAVTPLATLEGLATPTTLATLSKAPPALLRLHIIEQAMVSTYGILDLTGPMLKAGGLTDGPAQTAFSFAAHMNFMLGEVTTPEARLVLTRLLRPADSCPVIDEAKNLFDRLALERGYQDSGGDIDDFRASYMYKLTRVVERLDRTRDLAPLISKGLPTEGGLRERVATWCEKIFSGRVDELADDKLFEALRALHRIEVCKESPFCPVEQKRLLNTIHNEGFSSPLESIYGVKGASVLRQCELLKGAIDNYIVSSKTFSHPAHLIAAAQEMASRLRGCSTFAWEGFYRAHFKSYARTSQSENRAAKVVDTAL